MSLRDRLVDMYSMIPILYFRIKPLVKPLEYAFRWLVL